MQDPTDPLSPLGRRLLKLNPAAYAILVPTGGGNETARDLLQSVRPPELVSSAVTNLEEAAGMLSGLWLRFDWLDESHRISQSLETPSGSFWHAIMHRREGDFSNSKYWYARVGAHPSLATLAAQAPQMINTLPADKSLLRVIATGWNPSALVDLVEQIHDKPDDPRHGAAVALQKLEWQILFDHCTRAAVG
ncbi:MAG: hypothetical protein ABIP55_07495 [Tepidisphaeraceae bacterium]